MKTFAEAVQWLSREACATQEPVLTSEDLAACVTDAARWTDYAPASAVAVGATIAPTVPNGRLYRCLVGGTTADAEPTWPTACGKWTGQTITETTAGGGASGVVWVDVGPRPPERYDLSLAQRSAWLLKAKRTAILADVANGPDKVSLSQQHAQLLKLARRFRATWVV